MNHPTHTVREEWLTDAVRSLCMLVFQPADFDLRPETMRVTCSWPAGSDPSKAIGQCWKREASPLGVNEMFISPTMADPVAVLEILVHEMSHAYDDCQSKHGAAFKKIATKVGLIGKMTATSAGDVLRAKLSGIAANLGSYPHQAMALKLKEKPAKTYMLKCTCGEESCGFVFRATAKMIEKSEMFPVLGTLTCPACLASSVTVEGIEVAPQEPDVNDF